MKRIKTSIITRLNERDDILNAYFRDISKYKPIPHDELVQYIAKAQQGDENALEKVVLSNLRFVVSVAKKYINNRIDIKDLISEGNIGLIEAIYKYDLNKSKNVKFISYAVFHIQKRIVAYIQDNYYIVRVPDHVARAMYYMYINCEIEYTNYDFNTTSNNRTLNIEFNTYNSYENSHYQFRNTIWPYHVSLEQQLGPDDDKTIMDITEDEEQFKTLIKYSNHQDITKIVYQSIHALPKVEQKIVYDFFINNPYHFSMRCIAQNMGVSEHWLRNRLHQAINKMRNYIISRYGAEAYSLLQE